MLGDLGIYAHYFGTNGVLRGCRHWCEKLRLSESKLGCELKFVNFKNRDFIPKRKHLGQHLIRWNGCGCAPHTTHCVIPPWTKWKLIVTRICEPFVVYVTRINQSQCSPLLSHKRNEPITFESQYPFVNHWWSYCYLLVTHVWYTCNQLVMYLWPTLVTVYMKFSWKLWENLLKIEWRNFFLNWMKFSFILSEIFF